MDQEYSKIRALLIEQFSSMLNNSNQIIHEQINGIRLQLKKVKDEAQSFENRQLRQYHEKFIQKINQLSLGFSQSFSHTENQIVQLTNKDEQINKKMMDHYLCQLEHYQQNDTRYNDISKQISNLRTQIQQTSRYLKNFTQENQRQRKRIKQPKKIQQQPQQKKYNLTPMGNWFENQPQQSLKISINQFSTNYSQFQIKDDNVTKLDNQWRQLLSQVSITQKKQSILQIIVTESNNILFGIIDRKHRKDTVSVWDKEKAGDFIFYDLKQNDIRGGGIGYEKGLTPGNNKVDNTSQHITMKISDNTISWKIGNNIQNRELNIRNKRDWVPAIIMKDSQDIVKWI